MKFILGTLLFCNLVAVPGIYLERVNGVRGIGSMSHHSFACQADGKLNLQCRTLNIFLPLHVAFDERNLSFVFIKMLYTSICIECYIECYVECYIYA